MSKNVGCFFGWLANLLRGPEMSSSQVGPLLPKVIVNKRFVTDGEANFFRVLRAVGGARGHVLAQVSLKQLVWFPPGQDRVWLQT